jgi:transcriptional regulator with XRE-family HTH domain
MVTLSPDLLELRLAEVSDRIKDGREKSGLTLMQLGEQSGVAPSTIQKIESRQMTPSIAVIMKIAAGLQIEPADLIAPRNPARLDAVLQRAGNHGRISASAELSFEKLSADILGSELECWRVTVGPQCQIALPQPQTFEEVVIFTEKGRIELQFADGPFTLSAGDTLHCRSKMLTGLRNPDRRVASYLIAGRFPKGSYAGVAASIGEASLSLS